MAGLVAVLSRRKEARKEAVREAVHGEAGSPGYEYKEPPSPWRSEAGSPLKLEAGSDSTGIQHRSKGSRVGFRRTPSARPTSPRRPDRMPEVMTVGHAEISASPVRSPADLRPDLVSEVVVSPVGRTERATPATPADMPDTPGDPLISGDTSPAAYRATTSHEAKSSSSGDVYRATTSLEESSWRSADSAPKSASPPPEGEAPGFTAEVEDSPPSAAAGDRSLSPNIKRSLGLGTQPGGDAPLSPQHAQSASNSQILREEQPAPSGAGPPPPPRRRLPRSASASPAVSGEVRMAASKLSPIMGSPAAPQQPPGETSQLPSVKARLRTDAAAGGLGAVTGVTVQVLEAREDEEPPTRNASSQRDNNQPAPGESAISDLGQEMPARESDRSGSGQASPSIAATSAAQKSYVIQRLALGPGPFARHSPTAPSLFPVEARAYSSLLEASRSPSQVETLKHPSSSSSLDGPSEKEEMQRLALARNSAAGCAQHSPDSSPNSRALEALGRSSLAPPASSLAPRRRASPTAGAKKPAGGPPKKKPAKGTAKGAAKKGPVKRVESSLTKSPRAMDHSMSAAEGQVEHSDEDEDQQGGDMD